MSETKKKCYIVKCEVNVVMGLETAIADLGDAPTIDAVPVVRCKNCKSFAVYQFSGSEYCKHPCGLEAPTPDGFCSYGERRSHHDSLCDQEEEVDA